MAEFVFLSNGYKSTAIAVLLLLAFLFGFYSHPAPTEGRNRGECSEGVFAVRRRKPPNMVLGSMSKNAQVLFSMMFVFGQVK